MLVFDYFYGSVCHLCKRTGSEANVVLKFCSGCKLFLYCSYVHQKGHWPIHKEFCKCIQTILKKTGGSHLFQESTKLSLTDYKAWNKYRTSVMKLAECVMNRPLQPFEQQVFSFPPVCNICHHYEPNEMVPCIKCNSVIYCSVKHRDNDLSHQYVCSMLKLCLSIDIYISKYHNVSPYPDVSISIQELYTTLPVNMEKFIENVASVSGTKSLITSCLASEILSCPLTVLYVIQRVFGLQWVSKKDLILHIAGADVLELYAMNTWEIIFHWLPNLRYLHVILIGPGLNVPNIDVFKNVQLCSSCIINRKLEIHFKPNILYHDYINNHECPVPDIVLAFNSGLGEFEEPERDLWKNSIPSLLHFPSTLLVLTSYCKEESDHDIARVFKLKKSNTDTKILLNSKKNPFASFSPRRDWEVGSNNAVFYVNNYLSVIQT